MVSEFSLSRIRILLFSILACLITAGLFVEIWKYVLYLDRSHWWIEFLGLSYEQNLPTWYSSSLLLLCAIQLTLISHAASQQQAPLRWRWWILSGVFYYISLDEAVTIHEHLSHFFDLGGVLYFGWVIPAAIAVAVFGIFYLPFLGHLPKRTRWQFVLAGVTYVGGALGVELVLGYWTDLYGSKNLGYGLIDIVEESLEILGMTLFFLALLEYSAGNRQTVKITMDH